MVNRLEQLLQLYNILIEEFHQLQNNVKYYSKNSCDVIHIINEITDGADIPIKVYDNVATNISNVLHLVRKFNIRLEAYCRKCPGRISSIEELCETEMFESGFSSDCDVQFSKLEKDVQKITPSKYKSELNPDDIDDFIYEQLNLKEIFNVGTSLVAEVSYVDMEKSYFYILDPKNIYANSVQEIAQSSNLLQYFDIPPKQEIFGLSLNGQVLRAVRLTKSVYDKDSDEELEFCHLLDYGGRVQLHCGVVTYKLSYQQRKIPAQAIQCRIKIEDFCEQSLNHKYVQIKIIGLHTNYLEVSIIKGTETNQTGMPMPNNNSFEKFKTNSLTADAMEELYDEPFCTTNVMKAVMGHSPQDGERICRSYNKKTGGCFKGAKCQKQHIPLPQEGWTKDVLPDKFIFDKSIPQIVYRKGDIINITPTFEGECGMFYAQINDPNNALQLPLVWNDEDVPKWQRLEEPPHLLQVVLCRYSDGHWYRAQIINYDEEYKIFKVFYVDYGNTDLVRLRNLAKCDKGIARIAPQAVLCRINGYNTDISLRQSKEGIHLMIYLLLNNELNVEVISHGEDLLINFLDEPCSYILHKIL